MKTPAKRGPIIRSWLRLLAALSVSTALHETASSTPAKQRIVTGHLGNRDAFSFDWRRAHLRAIKFARRRG